MIGMPTESYVAMKRRLREVLSEWGAWSDDELDVVARFVEHEAVHYAAQAQMSIARDERPPTRKIR
jgi:hypothetical protein